MQAGRWGERGAPHLGLEVAFSTPFRSAEGRTWQRGREAQGVPQQPEESRGKLSGLGVFARRKRRSRVLAPRGSSQLPRARAAWESWLLLAPAAGPSLPSTIYSQARWDASLLPGCRCEEPKPAQAWGGIAAEDGAEGAAGRAPAPCPTWVATSSGAHPCCKSSPFLTLPAPSPAGVWGCWKCPPCQTLSCPCSRGPVPGQAGEAAPARRAHAFQRRVIGALCHSAAYNWRSIVSGRAG